MTMVWILVIVFIVIAVGAGIAQLAATWGDKKISDDIASDQDRLRADPGRDVPGEPGGGSGGGSGGSSGSGERDEDGDH